MDYDTLEKLCYPQCFRGACTSWLATKKWVGAKGREYLTKLCGTAKIQVMCSKNGKFHGDMNGRDTETMQFAQYLESVEGTPPQEGAPQLYLAQVPVYATEGGDAALEALLADLPPKFGKESSKSISVNIWMASRQGAVTSLHYDGGHNLLCVLAGEKRVTLLPPDATESLAPMPLWGESSNHSQIDFASPEIERFPGFANALETQAQVYEIKAGDALFIPEGYWHYTCSSGESVAVNIWWESAALQTLLNPEYLPYFLRQGLRSAITKKAEQILAETPQHPDIVKSRGPDPEEYGELTEGCLEQLTQLCKCSTRKTGATLKMLSSMQPPEIIACHCLIKLIAPTADDGCITVLSGLTGVELRTVLTFVSASFPEETARLLVNMDEKATALLIKRFEEADSDARQDGDLQRLFYEQLYAGVSDFSALQKSMIRKLEDFTKQAAVAVTTELLGVCPEGAT